MNEKSRANQPGFAFLPFAIDHDPKLQL